jgi:uncharacterized membrane protein YdjX (TVP38/TMEM64 family)
MSIKNLKNQNSKGKILLSIIKVLFLVLIVAGIPLYLYFFKQDWLMQFKDYNDVVVYLTDNKIAAIPIYIALQSMQIIISIIPGQIFQLAAGYVYTFFPATLMSIAGAFIGTTVSFYLARFLGSDFVHLFFGEEKTAEYVEKFNSKKAYVIAFLLYLIPGFPKDIVSYAGGISEMKYKPFIVISVVGRLPGMMGSILIGSMWHKQDYTGMIILGVLAVVAFIWCIINRKGLSDIIDKVYDKLNPQK